MKSFYLIAGALIFSLMASANEGDQEKGFSRFSDLPGEGPHGGHSREPKKPYYDKNTCTLRIEMLYPFEAPSRTGADQGKKFIIELYQISEDGNELTKQELQLYPGNRHYLFPKYLHKQPLKPFLFRSHPITEDCYNMREEEHWLFATDKTLRQIIKNNFDRKTGEFKYTTVLDFLPDGHLKSEATTSMIEDESPLKSLVQKELDKYYEKKGSVEPGWENPIFTQTPEKGGTILVRVHNRKTYMENKTEKGGGAFNFLVDPKKETVEFKQRDR